MSTVAIVSPGFPDVAGGVTDHTARLLRHWRESGRETQVVGSDGSTDPESVVRQLVEADTRAVLIQYVPFLYGRRGLSRFPAAVARGAKARGIRTVTFVHEPWVPPTRLPWLILSPLQRAQCLTLLRLSDQVVTAVPSWTSLFPHGAEVVYVGSTLGPVPELPDTEPWPAPVVFSPFAAGLNWDWIGPALRAIDAPGEVVVLGANRDDVRVHPSIRNWYRTSWDCRPRADGPTTLTRLGSARLVLAPFIDGLTGRRTSAMATLSTGARLVSSNGHLFDPFFENSPVAIARTSDQFTQDAVRLWEATDTPHARERRQQWHDARLNPRRLDARLLALLIGDTGAAP